MHIVAGLTLFLVNLSITIAMVIPPAGSGIGELAGMYKLASLAAGVVVYIVAARRRWFAFMLLFAILQLGAFLKFADYTNDLAVSGEPRAAANLWGPA